MTSGAFNPEMLVLARRSRSLTQEELAQRAGVSRVLLTYYETGTRAVPDDALGRLADALDYPIRFFCRTPTLLGTGGDAVFHRKRQSLPMKALYHAHACAEVRRLEVTTLLHLAGDDVPSLPEYPADFYDDPARIARTVRAKMNIPPGPVFNLTATLERNGCVIVAHDFESRHLDGFSQRPPYPPSFIHLNKALPPDRWRWTLAHELGHMVMHSEFMEFTPRLLEEQANQFAAEFLTPAHEIAPQLAGLTFQKLGGLKMEWRVSMQALITRAYHLNIISDRQRQSMFTRMAKAGYRTREPATLDPPVEKPTMMHQMARRHCAEYGYTPEELANLLTVNERDFVKHYTDDVWASIDDILRDI